MYHPKVIQDKLAAAVAAGYPEPEYHTRFEIESANKILDTARERTEDGGLVVLRDLAPDEIAWIRNERLICRNDFRYFLQYCRIKSEEDRVVSFVPRIAQEILLDIMAEIELERIAIMLQALKARQLGVSRLISLMVLQRIIFFPHVNAMIASSTPEKTRLLGQMLEFVLDRLPWWMPPQVTARREGELIEFGKMDTGLTYQHGSQITGICRGTTPTVGHLTELCEFTHPEESVDASLLRAMHDSERTMLVLESSAKGRGWWFDTWVSSKEGWPERRSRLRPVFLPWFVGTDLYPKAAWLRARPVPDKYKPTDYVENHARKAAEYVQSNYLLAKYLGKDWRMPMEQRWFYEVEYGEASRKGRVSKFLEEMPSSDDEAFQSSGTSVLSIETLIAHRSRIERPLGVYALTGPPDLVPARLQPIPSQVDYDQAPIPITWKWGSGYPINFTLVPLRWDGYATDSGLDKIYIWEFPQTGEIYGVGFDSADGVGKDRSVAEVLRKGSPWSYPAQCAEFATDKLNSVESTPYVMALAALYSPYDTSSPAVMAQSAQAILVGSDDFRRQCRVAIECMRGGSECQRRMRINGWVNFHPWLRQDGKTIAQDQVGKYGIYTNSWFRTTVTEYLVKMLRDMEIGIRSKFFVQEMETLEANDDRQNLRIEAAGNAHDDRFMSMGFIVISLYQSEISRAVAQSPTRPKPDKDSLRQYATYYPNLQESTL